MVLPNYKEIMALIKQGLDIEAQEKIMELRQAALDRQEENIELQKENTQLKQQLDISQKLQYEAPYYWKVDGDKKDGPYCQCCYDNNKKLIRLQQGNRSNPSLWRCVVCEKAFHNRNYGG